MAYEMKDNTGTIFNNGKKEKETHPDRTGKIMVDGKLYYVNGWVKKDKNGAPYLSVAVKPVTPKEDI